MPKVTVGLALGGGAARGLAHVGVIEVLRAEGVPVHRVAGTSMGALVGAMFCQDGDIREPSEKAVTFLRSPEFRQARIHRLRQEMDDSTSNFAKAVGNLIARGRVIASTVTRPSVLEAEDLYEILESFVDDRDIRSLAVPLQIVATDLASGGEVVIDKGSVIDAIAASSAVPGAFPPVSIDGRECVDGGVLNMVPISVVRGMGADYVIASNVTHELPIPESAMRALEVHFRTHQITKRALTGLQLRFADAVLTPKVSHTHWADFSRAEVMIEAGKEAAWESVGKIKSDLKRLARTPRFLWRKKVIPDEIST